MAGPGRWNVPWNPGVISVRNGLPPRPAIDEELSGLSPHQALTRLPSPLDQPSDGTILLSDEKRHMISTILSRTPVVRYDNPLTVIGFENRRPGFNSFRGSVVSRTGKGRPGQQSRLFSAAYYVKIPALNVPRLGIQQMIT